MIRRGGAPAAPVASPAQQQQQRLAVTTASSGTSAVAIDQPLIHQPTQRAITAIASQANAALGLFGITGSGKTSLAVTAIEEAWEVYQSVTLFYASDLGGWGNKLLSLIRLGICRVWYLRNHNDPFTTMELASQGAWPEHMIDRETGYAAPDVRLVLPRSIQFRVICPNGHVAVTLMDQAQVTVVNNLCPTCHTQTTAGNALRIDRVVVRSAGFRSVGHRIYDSMTQMSEFGQMELRGKAARGELPSAGTGGSVLGSADAVREGGMVFGTGSRAQVGFMQDRVPVWISNIRNIPDQLLPPIITFGVERSKGDDESGGIPIFGPKLAGNARTSSAPGWLGNCLYAAKEPHNPPETDEHGNVVTYHRLWLTNHIDPRDSSNTPIVAKHRGEPLGMPDVLEDSGKPEDAWQRCSLRVFYRLLRDQAAVIEARDKARYTNAPGIDAGGDEEDEILEVAPLGVGGGPTSLPAGTRVMRRNRRPTAQAPVVNQPVVEDAAAAVVEDAVPASPLVSQLEASLQAAAADIAAEHPEQAAVAQTVAAVITEAAKVSAPQAITEAAAVMAAAPAQPPATPAPATSAAPPRTTGTVSRIRRQPRPPAE